MTYRALDDFVKTRLNPLLSAPGSYYNSILDKDGDSIKGKKLRNSFLIFRSANKASSLEGVDLDYLSLDEYDRLSPSAEESANEALSSSKFGIRRKWSTPTSPGMGIDLLYNRSDKKQYLHKCSSCNHYNKMTFGMFEDGGNLKIINPDGIDYVNREVEDGSLQYVCNKCGKPLDRWYNGVWVSENPSVKSTSGYSISQLNAVWINADQLYRKYLTAKTKQTFYNYVIGEPYTDLSLAITAEDIYNHRRTYLPQRLENKGSYTHITIGVDWGNNHNIVVMGTNEQGYRDVINVFVVRDSSNNQQDTDRDIREVIERIRLYEPDLILADIGYNGNKVAKLKTAFGKRVYGVQVNPAKSNGAIEGKWSDNDQRVTIDKLTQNIILTERIKEGRLGFWKEDDVELQTILEHAQNVIIRDTEDDDGNVEKEITRKGADHYIQAMVYANVGMDRIIETYTKGKNSFGYTEVSRAEQQGMNDAFNDLFKKG